MTKEQIEKAIAGMDEYVPLRIIERHLQMPKTTLQKVVKGQRELPKKWSKPLEAYFERPKTVVQDLNKQSSGATKKPAENKPKTNYTINTSGVSWKASGDLSETIRPKNLEELKKMCPPELSGFDKSNWVSTERQKYGI